MKHPKITVQAIFLAAGSSRRMGKDNKLLLPYSDRTLVEFTFDKILKSDIDKILVITGFEQEKIQNLLQDKTEYFIYNKNHKIGMTSSIQAGVKALDENCSGFIIALSDMPFLKTEDYNILIRNFKLNYNNKPLIIQPVLGKRKGNPVIFSHHFKSEILDHDQPEGCREIIQRNKAFVVLVELENEKAFWDVDTPGDYKNLKY